MARALPRLASAPVVQLTGAVSMPDGDHSSMDMIRDVARAADGPAYVFYAPFIMPDAATANILRQQHDVARAIEQMTGQRGPRGARPDRRQREVRLRGGIANRGEVVRVGDRVHRPQRSTSAAAHALLQHLADVGFDRAPRFLGLDPQGREVLTYIPAPR
jgi:hypothetical protein